MRAFEKLVHGLGDGDDAHPGGRRPDHLGTPLPDVCAAVDVGPPGLSLRLPSEVVGDERCHQQLKRQCSVVNVLGVMQTVDISWTYDVNYGA